MALWFYFDDNCRFAGKTLGKTDMQRFPPSLCEKSLPIIAVRFFGERKRKEKTRAAATAAITMLLLLSPCEFLLSSM